METHVGWCVVMKFRGGCSFVVRKKRESIHLKNEKLWHHLKMILDYSVKCLHRGDRDAARGVFDDDRPVKFAVEVIGRDESADGDVLRYRDAALPVAERFEVGDRILRLRRTDREFGLRGPVASGRQRQQDRQRQQANACSRSHRAV